MFSLRLLAPTWQGVALRESSGKGKSQSNVVDVPFFSFAVDLTSKTFLAVPRGAKPQGIVVQLRGSRCRTQSGRQPSECRSLLQNSFI